MLDDGVHDAQRLKELQALPLDRKVRITQTRIMEWVYYWQKRGKGVSVSFSGGKDSTVLLDLARRAFPDIPAVFVNTGLEYPEIQKFAKSFPNVTELRPTMRFDEVVSRYGYPVISKNVADVIHGARLGQGWRTQALHGQYFYGENKDRESMRNCKKYLPLFETPVKISAMCCQKMKKEPLHKISEYPITAQTAAESMSRKAKWLEHGCNAFDMNHPISNPMSFWTEQDVLQYIRLSGTEICSVYGDVVFEDEDGNQYDNSFFPDCKLKCTGCQRTGCIFCAYGLHLEKGETRFQRLSRTHPRQYEYCIGGGQWVENSKYDSTADAETWNPKQIWVPSKTGLGMGKVFDMCNEIYGNDFMRYR